MADNTVSTLDNALNEYYKAGKLIKLAYERHPFFAMVPKHKQFKGDTIPIVPHYARTGGRSRVFATAFANASPELTERFNLPRVKDYGLSFIEMEALLAAADDEGSFLNIGTAAVESANSVVSDNLAMSLYRNHGGARGQIAAISSGTLTLTNPSDALHFEVNMKVRHATTDGTSGSLEAEAAITITGVDRIAGTLTASAWTGFDVGNYLFAEGDFGVSVRGIKSWIPDSVSGSDDFLGVNRSVDSRLRGVYVDGATAGYDHVEALEVLDTYLVREGAKPDACFLNPVDLRVIKTQLGSNLQYMEVDLGKQSNISFKALSFPSSGGKVIPLIADPDSPQGEAALLEMSTWKFFSLGDAPRGLNANGFKFITSEETDSVQIRVGYYGNLGCFQPNHNGRVKFAT